MATGWGHRALVADSLVCWAVTLNRLEANDHEAYSGRRHGHRYRRGRCPRRGSGPRTDPGAHLRLEGLHPEAGGSPMDGRWAPLHRAGAGGRGASRSVSGGRAVWRAGTPGEGVGSRPRAGCRAYLDRGLHVLCRRVEASHLQRRGAHLAPQRARHLLGLGSRRAAPHPGQPGAGPSALRQALTECGARRVRARPQHLHHRAGER